MKRWMAFLLACVLLLTAVPVPAWAEQMEEQEIVGLTEEPDQNTQNPDAPVSCVHQYESVVTEPNCTQEGYTTYACVLCGDTYVADYTEAKGCNTTWMPPVPATCTQEGIKGYYTCSRCLEQYWDAGGKSLIVNARDLLTPTIDHTMGDWEDMIVSTPDELGTWVRQCLNCDYNETTEAEPLPETLETPVVTVTYDEVTGKPILSWKKVEDAQTYWIYQCDPMEETRERLEVTEELEYFHEDAEAGKAYYYHVIASNETACSLPCELDVVTPRCAKPVLKISRDSETGKPLASWDVEAGAAAYEIYRATDKTNYVLIATVEGNSYLDTEAVVDKTYQYMIKAIGELPGGDSILSNVVSHTCDCARPVPVAVPGTSGGIQISWEKVEGGKKYTVYRSTSENGTYKALTTTTSLSYLDKGAPKNKVSYYKVDVFGASTASFSDYSEPVAMANHTFGAWKTVAPSTPEIEGWQERTCTYCGEVEGKVNPVLSRTLSKPTLTLKTDATTGKPVLSWSSVKNATKYQIYYLDDATGEQLYLGETTAKTYTHAEAETGMTHAYTVIAVNNTQCSEYAEAKRILCVCAKPVLKFTRDSETGKPIASWAAVEGASAYELYLSTNKKTYELIATVEGTSYLVEEAVVDKTYYYQVKAISEAVGADGPMSSVVSHTCDCARPVPTADYAENGGITISWEKVEGGKKYTIYRSTSENGTYSKIGTTSNLSYTDTKAPKNKVSYYKVDVYGASTASFSDYSEPVSAMNHTFGAWKAIVPSTPETEGLKERTCTGCGHLESRVTPVLSRVLGTPTLTVSVNTISGKPMVSWGSVKNATKYQVYYVDEATDERVFLEEVSTKTYTHKTAEVGRTYTYTVIAVNNTQCGNYSATKSITCICAMPVVKIIRDSETGKPIVTWEQVEGAAAYEIYRSTNKKTYELIASAEASGYLVEDAIADKTYYFRVKAVGEMPGTDSTQSSVVSHTCDCARPVAAATYGENGGIKISWEKVEGGKKYTVYRSATENGVYAKVGTTTALTYTDTKAPKNKISYYKVDVYGASTASFSDYSEPVSAMNHTFGAWKTIIPSTPETEGLKERTCTGCGHLESRVTSVLSRVLATPTLTVKNDSTTGKPVLSWGSVKKATKYQIFLVDTFTGTRTFLEEVTAKTYTHRTAVTGETYTYAVIAVNDTQCGNYSAVKTISCICALPVVKVIRDSETGKPIVTWEQVEGAAAYELYMSTNKKTYTLAASVEETSYKVEDAVVDKTYYFRVKAIGESPETDSAQSAVVSHTCDCARPVVTAKYAENGGITISWEKVTGGKKYTVYRSTTENGVYSKIGTTTALTYTDTKAPKNKVSYYKVDVYGSSTASFSDYSEPVSAINHTFGAWVTTIPSTPTEEGWQERSCTVCNLTEGKVKPVLVRSLGTPTLTVSANNTSGKPVLSWGAVKNASEYWVYLCGEEDVFLGATTSKTFTHNQAQANQEYTYKVMAVNATACGNFSGEKTVLCKLMAPELRIANDPDSGLPTVSWNRVDGAVEYALYWSQKETSGYELYAVTFETSIFVDQAAGGKSYYKIQAYHESNELANSELSDAYANVCKCRRPAGVTAGMVSETFNKVTWEAVTGATSYEIYRATEMDGTYTKIATTSYSYYLDSNLPADHEVYYYQVTAMTSLEGTTSARSEAAAAETLIEGLLKVYVSPSSQTDNKYAYGNVTEAAVCREISLYLVDALTRCGISAITNVQKDMYARVPESNAWGADLHVPVHTNAFNQSAQGTQVYYKSDAGKKVAKAIFNHLAPIVPGTSGDSVRKVTDLYEITKSNATVAYVEAAFHDRVDGAKWIIEHKVEIAEAICKGICESYGILYVAP